MGLKDLFVTKHKGIHSAKKRKHKGIHNLKLRGICVRVSTLTLCVLCKHVLGKEKQKFIRLTWYLKIYTNKTVPQFFLKKKKSKKDQPQHSN